MLATTSLDQSMDPERMAAAPENELVVVDCTNKDMKRTIRVDGQDWRKFVRNMKTFIRGGIDVEFFFNGTRLFVDSPVSLQTVHHYVQEHKDSEHTDCLLNCCAIQMRAEVDPQPNSIRVLYFSMDNRFCGTPRYLVRDPSLPALLMDRLADVRVPVVCDNKDLALAVGDICVEPFSCPGLAIWSVTHESCWLKLHGRFGMEINGWKDHVYFRTRFYEYVTASYYVDVSAVGTFRWIHHGCFAINMVAAEGAEATWGGDAADTWKLVEPRLLRCTRDGCKASYCTNCRSIGVDCTKCRTCSAVCKSR